MTETVTPFARVCQAIDQGQNVFISGVGGCGKSYLMKQLHKHYKEVQKKKVVLASTTGISAYNLGGITIHSWTKIIVPSVVEDAEQWTHQLIRKLRKKGLAKKYQETQMIFIDEVSMLGANYMDVFNFVAQELRGNHKPFGGIQLILGGDMMQLSPVRDDFPFESASWEGLNLTYFHLTKAYRFDHQSWVDLLHRARLGRLTQEDKNDLMSRLNVPVTCTPAPVFLASKNNLVDQINKIKYDAIKKPGWILKAKDFNIVKDDEDTVLQQYEVQLPDEVSDQFMAEKVLHLKEDCEVMLLANLNVEAGLTNGTRGVVKKIELDPINGEHVVDVLFENSGLHQVRPYQFPLEYKNRHHARCMIPLKLAFATSIHKSQSLTLNSVEMDIGTDVFIEGQSYVALSRCKSLQGLYIKSIDFSKIKPHPKALRFEISFLREAIPC